MLADSLSEIQSGHLSRDIHLPATAKLALLDFVAHELPAWRDHPERPKEHAETRLTEHLCDYLNSATSNSVDWSHVQFRTETRDETNSGRAIDLSVKPLGLALVIEGRRHTMFEALLPIECKRLPTPSGPKRDGREYVFSKYESGGIQRFKVGHHGASHAVGAMIAYVQEHSCRFWDAQVSAWINELSRVGQLGWTAADLLCIQREDRRQRLLVLRSEHTRPNTLPGIELHHLWIEMH
jgi:hypothetical protein